jgi:putative membrane protein
MVRDHGTVNKEALAIVKKLNVTPEDSPTSQALTSQGDAKRKGAVAEVSGIRK